MRWYEPLRRQSDFAALRRRGRRAGFETLSAYGVSSASGRPRVGVSVSKAVGGAVTRNLVRRRIQGALDSLPGSLRTPASLLFIARPAAAQQPYARVARDVVAAVEQLGRR